MTLMDVIEQALKNEVLDRACDHCESSFLALRQTLLAALRPAVEQWERDDKRLSESTENEPDEYGFLLQVAAHLQMEVLGVVPREAQAREAAELLSKIGEKLIAGKAVAHLDEAAERVRFEQWAEFIGHDVTASLSYGPTEYLDEPTRTAWESWLAAKRDERERR